MGPALKGRFIQILKADNCSINPIEQKYMYSCIKYGNRFNLEQIMWQQLTQTVKIF